MRFCASGELHYHLQWHNRSKCFVTLFNLNFRKWGNIQELCEHGRKDIGRKQQQEKHPLSGSPCEEKYLTVQCVEGLKVEDNEVGRLTIPAWSRSQVHKTGSGNCARHCLWFFIFRPAGIDPHGEGISEKSCTIMLPKEARVYNIIF